ncbi:hypothetical protein [Lebetimonas natsushimae]|nr:hypothetical protein [Lebetimonas natsushimae]
MKKVFLFFIFIFLYANSNFENNIDNEVLLIEAKLYPKILYLVNENEKKDNIKVAILINKNTKKIGKKLKKLINDKKIKVDLINKINLKYDAYIFTTKKINNKDLKLLLINKKVIFTVFPNRIENAMFSIYIGPKIYPYINPKLLNKAEVKFNPILLKVGKIYEK